MPSLRHKKSMFSFCAVVYEEPFDKWFPWTTSTSSWYGKKIEGRKILNFNVINVIYFEVRKSLFLSPWNCYHMILYLSVYTLNKYYRRIQTCLPFYPHFVSETSYIYICLWFEFIWRYKTFEDLICDISFDLALCMNVLSYGIAACLS